MPADSPELALLAAFELSIDGTPLNTAKRDAVLDVIVEQSSELPDSCIVRFTVPIFQEGGEDLLGENVFPEGADLKVSVSNLGQEKVVVFEGEIVGVDLDLTSLGPSTLTVRALHHAHRLMRGTKRRNFLQSKDSDIFSKVVGESGLSNNTKATKIVHPYTIQDNLTDWDFLKIIARRSNSRIGCGTKNQVVLEDFSGQSSSVKVKWSEDLINFHPRTHGAGQISSVEVHGWDQKTKQKVVGTANSTSDGVPKAGAEVGKAKSKFPDVKHVLTNQPVASQSEAEVLAKSVLRQLRGRFLQMEALCSGNPSLKPGKTLEVSNVGGRFNGKYPITAATHTYSASEGYMTQVFSLGRDSEGLLPTLGGNSASGGSQSTSGGMGSGGLVVGIVTDNNDPEKLGRVKVKYPSLDESQESFWCRLVNPMAGGGRGLLIVPEINDEVLVGFEQGDPHYPFIIGALWNGVDKPPDDMGKAVTGGKVMRRMLKSRIGHTVLLDDDPQNQQVQVITKDGHYVKLDDKNKKLEIIDSKGQNKIVIDSGESTITMEAVKNINVTSVSGDITIKASAGGIKLDAMKNIEFDAKQKVTGKGLSGLEMTSPAPVKVESSSQLDLKSTGLLNVDATGLANIKSAAILNIQGTLVKIN